MSKDFRCKGCCRLLFKGQIQLVEIKCPRCGCLQKIDGCRCTDEKAARFLLK